MMLSKFFAWFSRKRARPAHPTFTIEYRPDGICALASWPVARNTEEQRAMAQALARTAFLMTTGELTNILPGALVVGGHLQADPVVAGLAGQLLQRALASLSGQNSKQAGPLIAPLDAFRATGVVHGERGDS